MDLVILQVFDPNGHSPTFNSSQNDLKQLGTSRGYFGIFIDIYTDIGIFR